ncbi:MAG: hypothetical protein EOP04_09655, partial [Proteobacteria bacterium]
MITRLAQFERILQGISWVAIALGILPSFSALSQNISTVNPRMGAWLGPINFLKLSLPVLILFTFMNRSKLTKRAQIWIGSFLIIGTLSTLISSRMCAVSPLHFREWAVIVTGVMGAVAFSLFEVKAQKTILYFWVFFLTLGIILNYAALDLLNALHLNLFDPNRIQGPG